MATASVLIVDDEPAFLRVVSTAIRILGYEPIPAKDAETALEVLENTTPALVLTDVCLPGMDGVSLAHAIKSDEDTARIPVLLMSGFGRPACHQGDGFLGKPFHIDELLAFIGPYVEAHEASD
jgi:CheY-like chemotaxis protein